jgi:hypothetical protein
VPLILLPFLGRLDGLRGESEHDGRPGHRDGDQGQEPGGGEPLHRARRRPEADEQRDAADGRESTSSATPPTAATASIVWPSAP